MIWWMWVLALFFMTLGIGIVAPIAGVGGGVLFTPLTMAFYPFSTDFIRGAGLVMAMTSALSSAPHFAKKGLANLRILAPVVVVSIIFSILGGVIGLWVTNAFPQGKSYIKIGLGLILFVVFLVYLFSKRVEFPQITHIDPISEKLDIHGAWYEPSLKKVVEYRTTNLLYALPAFAGVGFIAGMFGLGAGWANVPVLNLVMGAPLKVATSTSMMIITINDAAACWVYMARGAMLAFIIVPSVLGITIGARIGARIAVKSRPRSIKYLVMAIMLFAAVMDIWKGLHGLGMAPPI